MSAQHTPGPWSVVCVVYGSNVHPDIAWIGYGSCRPKSEHQANARLIAAAPDMLEALMKADKFISNYSSESRKGSFERMKMEVKAAIAKAKGEKP